MAICVSFHISRIRKAVPNRSVVSTGMLLAFLTLPGIALSIAQKEQPSGNGAVRNGELVFASNCASCHDVHSRTTLVGPGLKGYYASRRSASEDNAVRKTIIDGKGSMPGFPSLSSSEVSDLVSYLKTL
jgi:mono/diheme cytochrome c family protein